MEYADIPLIDLSAAFTKDGRANLEVTKQLVDAMHKVGFCYVVNHGYSPEQVRALNYVPSLRRALSSLLYPVIHRRLSNKST